MVLLIVLRKWVTGIFKGYIYQKQDAAQNLEDYIGQRAIVRKKIEIGLGGRVEFHGTEWNAYADTEIPEGKVVEIIGKDNLTLKVKSL